MGMTMTQKILAAHAGLETVTAGQLIEAKLDVVMANDITGPMALPIFREMAEKVFDKDKYQRDEALLEMQRLYPGCRYIISEGCQFHSPFEYWEVVADNMLFDEVYEGPLMIAEKLILSHEPVDVPWAYNIHGHDHQGHKRKNHINVCVDVTGYQPINMNQFMKSGALAHVETIHRDTIDKATERKRKREGKKIGEK